MSPCRGIAAIRFPDGFLWGASTAGHQVEGGNVNADLWPLEWAEPSLFAEPSGDACDHYHRYPEDIATLADLGSERLPVLARVVPHRARARATSPEPRSTTTGG